MIGFFFVMGGDGGPQIRSAHFEEQKNLSPHLEVKPNNVQSIRFPNAPYIFLEPHLFVVTLSDWLAG